jgi:hypothetical protein
MLDDTLSPETQEAIDMIDMGLVEGAKDKYPDVDKGEFADPANRAFPIDTADHARAAMVYLNKYFNNPSASGVTANYSKQKFVEVHNRIVKAMKKFGIEHNGCSIDKQKSSATEMERRDEDMPDEISTEEEVVETEATITEVIEEETTEDTVEETTEATSEEEVASEETATEEEEPVIEASEEATTEEEVEEDTAASEDTEDISSKLKSLMNIVSDIQTELENSQASTEEEATASEVDMLSKELAEANEKLGKYEAMEKGSLRLNELAKAGVEFDADSISERALRVGRMSDEEYEDYSKDLISIAKASAPEETEDKQEAVASNPQIQVPDVFLPNVTDPEKKSKVDEYKEIYAKD